LNDAAFSRAAACELPQDVFATIAVQLQLRAALQAAACDSSSHASCCECKIKLWLTASHWLQPPVSDESALQQRTRQATEQALGTWLLTSLANVRQQHSMVQAGDCPSTVCRVWA
jgi:hypothetical protein